ncbi:immunity 49 family protein [Nocardia cyriacigeorgica]|uniref:immunity 49 family protein n=1 Tax=Nocardia cyriacigeorgica TaxID=135487 RepID=UPI002456CB62|nr:immunity 49 family protein [Nocardia cyriacigeorgica]
MISIERHYSPGTDDREYAEFYEQQLEKTMSWLDNGRPPQFDLILATAQTNLYAQLAIDPRGSKIETWQAVVSALQIAAALFTAANTPKGTPTQCFIDHEQRVFPGTGPNSATSAGNWLFAFWLAIVCRDQKRMSELCNIPIELLRASGAEYDEYIYDWVDTLQTYWLERDGLVEKLTRTIEKSDPSAATIAPRDLLNYILYQPIELFHQFLRRNQDDFNQALAEAVRLHKKYWTANEKREMSNVGYLALGPLAITCLAYDAGLSIDVESDYLPNALLERKWLGEFPT